MTTAGLSPFDGTRRAFFRARLEESVARRRSAREAVAALQERLEREVRALRDIQGSHQLSGQSGLTVLRLMKREQQQGQLVERIESEIHRFRKAAQATHSDRLVEWTVRYERTHHPSPGEVLLARRSKKPYAQH